MSLRKTCLAILVAMGLFAAPASAAETKAQAQTQAAGDQPYADPLAPFNEAMFTFNLKLDEWVLRPVASGWATVMPEPGRKSVERFFNNADVIPRFANELFQLRFPQAGSELGRFAINSTVGVAGLFDPADYWFGLKQNEDDFGLTLSRYGVGQGPYLVLPFFGPSTIRDTVGRVADGAMNPINYVVPIWVVYTVQAGYRVSETVNYRSLNLQLFEDVDRYSVDLYGAVQDGYLQRRRKAEVTIRE